MHSLQLLSLLTLMFCGTYAASSNLNQIWWTKYTGSSTGCSSMCCSGRNSSCHNSGPRIGGIVSANGKCFCDEGCLDMDDCCEDYSLQCQGRTSTYWNIKTGLTASNCIIVARERFGGYGGSFTNATKLSSRIADLK